MPLAAHDVDRQFGVLAKSFNDEFAKALEQRLDYLERERASLGSTA